MKKLTNIIKITYNIGTLSYFHILLNDGNGEATITMHLFHPQLVTDAYRDFAHALQSNTKEESDGSMIESARVIEEFAFRYAPFNLNASKNTERKENQHIGQPLSRV